MGEVCRVTGGSNPIWGFMPASLGIAVALAGTSACPRLFIWEMAIVSVFRIGLRTA